LLVSTSLTMALSTSARRAFLPPPPTSSSSAARPEPAILLCFFAVFWQTPHSFPAIAAPMPAALSSRNTILFANVAHTKSCRNSMTRLVIASGIGGGQVVFALSICFVVLCCFAVACYDGFGSSWVRSPCLLTVTKDTAPIAGVGAINII